jgi:hypothetical protein
LDESSDEESVQRFIDDARSSSSLPSGLISEIKTQSQTNELVAIEPSANFDNSEDEFDLKLSPASSIEPQFRLFGDLMPKITEFTTLFPEYPRTHKDGYVMIVSLDEKFALQMAEDKTATCTYPIGFIIGLVFRLGLRVLIGSFELNVSPIAPCSIRTPEGTFLSIPLDVGQTHLWRSPYLYITELGNGPLDIENMANYAFETYSVTL